jgi:hypothetical protein
LLLYQPMTARARHTWRLARLLAGTGLLGLLPDAERPPLPDRLLEMVPSGGTFAVASTSLPSRRVVLILDAEGVPDAVAKVAGDEMGRHRLAAEAHALGTVARRLTAPVIAPSLLAAEPDFIVVRAAAWRPRREPWQVPPGVAAAMGRFYATRGHPSHGDFAPWNVMRTVEGWVLVDWEDVRFEADPFSDLFHYLVQAHALLGHPRRHELMAGVRGTGWVASAVRAYAEAAGIETEDAGAAFARYLATSAKRLERDPRRRGARKAVLARRRLLADIAATRRGWP